jgi:hypothetical protein
MRAKATGLAALITIPTLLLATACGGGGDGGSGAGAGSGGDDRPAVALTRDQLEKALLTKNDLPGYQISDRQAAGSAVGQPQSDLPRCQPIADVLGDEPSPAAKDTVRRGLGPESRPGAGFADGLSSYSEEGARTFMRELRAAVAACGDGFKATIQGKTASYSDIRAHQISARGDEVISYTMIGASDGVKFPIHLVLVRDDATVALFMGIDLLGKKPLDVPQEVVDKQVAKLAEIARRAPR